MKKELVVVGAGPAGISCALECIDSKVEVVVLERNIRIGGQLPLIPSPIHNFAGGVFENGAQVRDKLEKIAFLALDGSVLTGTTVEEVNLASKCLKSDKGVFEAQSILIATGYRFRRLPIEVSDSLASDVLYTTRHRRNEISGKRVVIVGGGDSAMLTALDLVEDCPEVHLVARSTNYKARPDVIESVLNNPRIKLHERSNITAASGGEHLESVTLTSKKETLELPCEKLLVKIGYVPNTELFRGQLEMDSGGHIKVGEFGATSVPGVFAAGDIVTPGYDRIAFACGSASLATRGIRKFLGHNV